MELTYLDGSRGKSTAASDVTEVAFVELLPDERVVQKVVFDYPDPAFAGTHDHDVVVARDAAGDGRREPG